MKTEDLQNAYQNPPEDFHNALIFSLCKLEEKPRQRYKSRPQSGKNLGCVRCGCHAWLGYGCSRRN